MKLRRLAYNCLLVAVLLASLWVGGSQIYTSGYTHGFYQGSYFMFNELSKKAPKPRKLPEVSIDSGRGRFKV